MRSSTSEDRSSGLFASRPSTALRSVSTFAASYRTPGTTQAPIDMGWTIRLILLLFLLGLEEGTLFFASASIDIPGVTGMKSVTLTPDQPVNNIRMPSYDGELRLLFEGLSPNSQYDIKISYPGTTPTHFVFSKADDLVHKEGLRRRRLLDTEKYRIVTTGSNANVPPMYLHTTRYGVSYDAKIEQRPVVFNIVLETLVFGAIPKETLALIVFLFFALSVTYRVYLPFLRRTLEDGLTSSPFGHEKL